VANFLTKRRRPVGFSRRTLLQLIGFTQFSKRDYPSKKHQPVAPCTRKIFKNIIRISSRRSVAGFLPKSSGFDSRPIHVRFLGREKRHWGTFFSGYIGFPPSASFNRWLTLFLKTNHKDKLEKPASFQTKGGISETHLDRKSPSRCLLTLRGRAMAVTRHVT
jgi:hypothetical protein